MKFYFIVTLYFFRKNKSREKEQSLGSSCDILLRFNIQLNKRDGKTGRWSAKEALEAKTDGVRSGP